jgi:hypothetical protein
MKNLGKVSKETQGGKAFGPTEGDGRPQFPL